MISAAPRVKTGSRFVMSAMNLRISFCALTLMLMLTIAGCAIDQKLDIAQYRKVLDSNTPPPTPYDDHTPLTLTNSMSLANANSESLASRGEDYVQALIDKNRVVANFLPTISFQPNYTLEEAPRGAALITSNGSTGSPAGGVSSSGGVSGFRRLNDNVLQRTEAPVVGNINLFRGGGDVASLRAVEFNISAQREFLLDLQATTFVNVAQTFYAVLRAEQSVDVLKNSVQLQEARLRDVEQQFKNGLAIRLTVLQTRGLLDSTRVSLTQAQSDARNGRSALALLIGVPRVEAPLRDDANVPDALLDEEAFERRALEIRPDIIAAHNATLSARANVDSAIAQYYPSVSLNVSGFLYREFYDDASRWNAILLANLPIFSAGIIEANVRTAWSQLRQAALAESLARRTALNQVQTAYDNLWTTDRRLRDLRDQVDAFAEALTQAQAAFKNNLAINLDVLNAQDQLLSSQLQVTSASFDRAIFYLELLRASGDLLPRNLAAPSTHPATTQTATQPAASEPAGSASETVR